MSLKTEMCLLGRKPENEFAISGYCELVQGCGDGDWRGNEPSFMLLEALKVPSYALAHPSAGLAAL